MTVSGSDLSQLWEKIVRDGQIRSRFAGLSMRQIESGIRMTADGPEHYAIDREDGSEIGAGVMERRLEGSTFTLQFNPYRSLKPKAETLGLGRQPDASSDVKDCLFACQEATNPLSLLRRDVHLRVELPSYQWAAVHNALPVEKNGHFLWVPASMDGPAIGFPHWIQILTRPLLEDFLALASRSTGLMTLFNGMHAGASVNHIHYHSVYRMRKMPIEEAPIISKGGRFFLADYPASGLVYGDGLPAQAIWRDVERLQGRKTPFNLIHCEGRTFLIARNVDNEVIGEFPAGVLAGMELAGRPITTDEPFYKAADWASIQAALHKSTLRDEEILAILRS